MCSSTGPTVINGRCVTSREQLHLDKAALLLLEVKILYVLNEMVYRNQAASANTSLTFAVISLFKHNPA